jgi:hypothetical protein
VIESSRPSTTKVAEQRSSRLEQSCRAGSGARDSSTMTIRYRKPTVLIFNCSLKQTKVRPTSAFIARKDCGAASADSLQGCSGLHPPISYDGRTATVLAAMLRRIIRPTAIRAKITKRIGWHTLRRTLATLLVGQGTSVKLTQEMTRHANSRITLELYAQSNMAAKLEAQPARELPVHTGNLFPSSNSSEEGGPASGC